MVSSGGKPDSRNNHVAFLPYLDLPEWLPQDREARRAVLPSRRSRSENTPSPFPSAPTVWVSGSAPLGSSQRPGKSPGRRWGLRCVPGHQAPQSCLGHRNKDCPIPRTAARGGGPESVVMMKIHQTGSMGLSPLSNLQTANAGEDWLLLIK